MPYDEFMLADRGWFGRLMMCPDYTDRVIRRWNLLRRDVLSEERLVSYKQEVEDFLGSAIDRNFEVWGYSFDFTQLSHIARRNPSPAQVAARAPLYEGMSITAYEAAINETHNIMTREMNPASFEEAMTHHRDYMIARGRWLDSYIETLRQYSHPSRHAVFALR